MTDLGDRPTPEIEPSEPPPGGVDAVDESLYEPQPLVPELSQVGNAPGKDEIPDEVTEPDDSETEASAGGVDADDDEPSG